MKKRTRTILGLILILSAVALMFFWEMSGREQMRSIPLLVADRDLMAGELAVESMFAQRRAAEEDRVSGALKPEQVDKILGSRILYPIPKNSQIVEESFGSPRHFMGEGQGVFLLRGEWIFSVSSSLRRGDRIRIYGLDGTTELGEFQVAFVKDAQGKEVTAGEEEIRKGELAILDRAHSTGRVEELEILAEISAYRRILDYLFHTIDPEEPFGGYSEIISRKLIIQQEEQKKGEQAR